MLVDIFMNVSVMIVSQTIKKTYSVDITPWRAIKANQITMDYLVGGWM